MYVHVCIHACRHIHVYYLQYTSVPPSISEPTPLPSFVSCFGSQVLLLLDVNGMVWPLANGLRLRPPSDRKHAFRAPPQPLRPYASIVSRQHAASKEENVLVFVLGKLHVRTLEAYTMYM